MDVVQLILQILLVVISLVLIAVVLMQSSTSSGLGDAFGSGTQALSARGRAASKEAKLQKLTKILAVVIGVIALAMAAITKFAA